MARTQAPFDIYPAGEGDPVRVVAGPLEFLMTERKYGALGSLGESGALEPNLYMGYLAGKRAGIGADLSFDAWMHQYEPGIVDDDGEAGQGKDSDGLAS